MDDINKSLDAMIDDLFADPIVKASENFEVANASKTTADAVMAEAPASENDEARGAGRPKAVSDVPKVDQDGSRDKGYEAVQEDEKEEEPEETKQAKDVSQVSKEGHLGEKPKMKDPRLSKSLTEEEYAEFQAFKKSQAETKAKAKQEELKKAEDLKKVETEELIKSAVTAALSPLRRENEELKKSFIEQGALIKAMAGQPQRSKSITGIEALEKSMPESVPGQSGENFSKSDKLDAAESLFKAGKIPMEAVIELDNTGNVFNSQHRALIEKKLLGQ